MSVELEPAVQTLKANLPIEKLNGDSRVLAIESGSFLWSSGLMKRLMQDVVIFRIKTEQAAPLLRTGIHAGVPYIWNSLPEMMKEE